MEAKLKHLELIQGVVNRLANDSFLVKAWTVTLVAALFGLAGNQANPKYFGVAFIPVFIFWILDGYFLWQERLYRGLYNQVATKPVDQIDFLMDTRAFRGGKNTWPSSIFSMTLLIFYGALVVAMAVVILL